MQRSNADALRGAGLARRRFVQGLAAGGVLFGLPTLAAQAQGRPAPARTGSAPELRGTEFDLVVAETPVNFTGHARSAITVNGSLPAPILRGREGSEVELRVTNALPAGSIHGSGTSIHWHGVVVPANMDGVPGLSFNGIHHGES